MNSDNGSRDRFLGFTSVNPFVSAYFDAWQNYSNTLNDIWGELTSTSANQASWASAFNKLLKAWTDGVTQIHAAYVPRVHGSGEESVVVFVIDSEAQSADPRCVLIPGAPCNAVESTTLCRVGGGTE